jgi:hypothetical protein
MYNQLNYLFALEVVRERTREAEARARLHWGVEPEPPVARRGASRFATLCREVTDAGADGQCARLELAVAQHPGGQAPA